MTLAVSLAPDCAFALVVVSRMRKSKMRVAMEIVICGIKIGYWRALGGECQDWGVDG